MSNWLRMARVYNRMFDELRKRVSLECGCTLPQFDVLAQLYRSQRPLTFVELSKLLLVTSGNLTGIVDRLEKADYVKRRPDTQDRRVIRVMLTQRGVRLMERMIPKHQEDVKKLMSCLTRADALQLRRILGVLREGLQC